MSKLQRVVHEANWLLRCLTGILGIPLAILSYCLGLVVGMCWYSFERGLEFWDKS